ncbi:unnamed protein product [Soboliphyme baturini]|uniref:Uncharacterized protein n=1 Tax=Soboliphyme baturini TaxID=241478 RepID=A0A183IEF9_9BILA|nr:unnamed protein product [Soboliphyme baturini]
MPAGPPVGRRCLVRRWCFKHAALRCDGDGIAGIFEKPPQGLRDKRQTDARGKNCTPKTTVAMNIKRCPITVIEAASFLCREARGSVETSTVTLCSLIVDSLASSLFHAVMFFAYFEVLQNVLLVPRKRPVTMISMLLTTVLVDEEIFGDDRPPCQPASAFVVSASDLPTGPPSYFHSFIHSLVVRQLFSCL